MAKLVNAHLMPSTGVAGVGEFVERGVEPRRSISFFMERSIGGTSAKTQGRQDGLMEVGVSHSSDEAG